MPHTLAKYKLRLSSKLLLANLLSSVAFLLIAVFIIIAFASVRSKSSDIANKDLENIIRNTRLTRELSRVFSEIDLLDRAIYRDADYFDAEGERLNGIIVAAQRAIEDEEFKEGLYEFSDRFHLLLAHGAKINDALHTRKAIDQDLHLELTKLEVLISDRLIETTLAGEDTDFVMQQLALVNGYRESLLHIARLFAESDINRPSDLLVTKVPSVLVAAIDDLRLRLYTITASSPEVATQGERLIKLTDRYEAIVERILLLTQDLYSLREDLNKSKTRTLSAIARLDKQTMETALTTAGRIRQTVTNAGAIVVFVTLIAIVLFFFITRHLIKFHIQSPLNILLAGIGLFQRGELQSKIALEQEDEWDLIGQSLNSMAADLDHSRKELHASYLQLERRVEERTKELAETVKALSKSESSLQEAQRIAHLGYWSWEFRSGENVWSEEQYRIFGIEPSEVDANYDLFVSFLHPEDSQKVLKAISSTIKNGTGYNLEYRIVRKDGTVRWIEAQAKVRRDDKGEPIEMSGTVLDITERKRIEHLLIEEKERALVTLHSIGDAVIVTDATGNVEYLNPVAEKLTGCTLNEARGQTPNRVFRILNEETRETAEDPIARCLREGKIVGLANHTILLSSTGTEYAIQDSAAPIQGPTGEILGVVLVFSDVTEARRLSRQLSYDASHDGLTGLNNRQEFERRLERVVETAHAESTENALCYLDLDQFKLINDTCGHVAGDEALRQVGSLLREQVRHRDTIARLGGDEFGLLMEHCSLQEAEQVCRKLLEAVSEHEFLWDDKRFKIGVSMGLIAINESSPDSNGLLSAADTACLVAKEQGRNRFHVFQEDDKHFAQKHGEMQWAVRLTRALQVGGFRLYFQPMVPVVCENINGAHYEVLIRLEDDQFLSPITFLPAADRYQLSSQLDRWVIATTFQWLVDHPEHLKDLFICAINLSGHSLNDETFLAFVNQSLQDSQISPEKICFEITETVAIANFSRAANFMKGLKDQGCRFALDDFGSGLSSFAYLKNLPVDFLKIDGVFIKDILDDALSLALVKSINDIGQVMGIRTIAEYVENEAILDKLREIGMDYAQGFGIDRPRPIEELLQ